jgi:hypothetical protein
MLAARSVTLQSSFGQGPGVAVQDDQGFAFGSLGHNAGVPPADEVRSPFRITTSEVSTVLRDCQSASYRVVSR